jgi:hypothetical protein
VQIKRVLARQSYEVLLIEGHTNAVGSTEFPAKEPGDYQPAGLQRRYFLGAVEPPGAVLAADEVEAPSRSQREDGLRPAQKVERRKADGVTWVD